MKKFYSVTALALLCVGCMVLTSCKDKDDEKVLGPAGTKSYLEEVALEMAGKVDVKDFEHYVKLVKHVNDNYVDGNASWDNDVEGWAENIMDNLMGSIVKTSMKTEKQTYYYTYTYNYYYNHYQGTILASNFKGHWTYNTSRRKWQHTSADDIQFIFPNQSGEECVLKAVVSGSVKKAYLFYVDDYKRMSHPSNYVWNEYYDRKECTLGVPEQIVITLTEGGRTLITQTVKINLDDITDETFDIGKSKFSFTSNTVCDNGYVMDVKNAAYTAKSATVEFTLTKNGERLVHSTISNDLKNVPQKQLTDLYDMNGSEIDDLFADANGTSAFSVDVLGKVQVKGTCGDAHKLADCLDELEDAEDEATYKKLVNDANTTFEANLYYNGTSTRQAYVRLEAFDEDEWDDDYYDSRSYFYSSWSYRPIICFPDGTSYSCANYFNEDDFTKIIDEYNRQEDAAEDMW